MPLWYPPNPPLHRDDRGGAYAGEFVSGQRTEPGRTVTGDIPQHAAFDIVDKSNATDGLRVRLYEGTVKNTIPSGFSLGDTPPYIIPISVSVYIWLVFESETPTLSVDWGAGGPPVDDFSSHTAYLTIGSVAVIIGKLNISKSIAGSQWFQWCGSSALWGLV